MNRDEIRALGPVTDLTTAAGVFGISRSKAHELARHRPDELPFRVLRVGSRYKVPTSSILDALGPEVVDEIDWKAKYDAVLAQSRKWEKRCRANAAIIRQLTGVADLDDLPDTA
jgi:hypothetical protein